MKTGIGCATLLCLMGSMADAAASGNIAGSIESDPIDYQNHFHIYLNPPAPLEIGPAHLLADNPLAMSTDPASSVTTLQTEAQGLLDYAQTLTEGEEIMFTLDVPYVPAQDTPIVLVQAATPSAAQQPDYLLKACTEFSREGGGVVDPAGMLAVELENRGHKYADFSAAVASIKLTQLEGTKHGKLTAEIDNVGMRSYLYVVDPGYLGKDKAVFMAEFEGKRYKVVINFVITEGINENSPQCPPSGTLIKVNPKPASGSSSLVPSAITLNIADLPGGAVGQIIASTITLDDNAAGNGWFIDTTPWDNSEYLPTSNPYEWVAKAGSDAAGKMDMLSVLLHEYGHALGIDHSADGHDYMATTLTPGVRRMPSAEELALMQQLVAQAKGEMVANASTPSPTQGGGGLPLPIPLGAGFGIAFLGRMRKSSYGGTSIDFAGAPPITQYAVAANATFTNLATPAGWNTQGSVDITPTSFDTSGRTVVGSATLNEVSTSQTRLSQVFMLNDKDRYLSFTLSGAALDDLNGAPDDAFEVALLDATTGLSVLGGNGLTRTDAFLNLQGDGTQHASGCVTCIYNADGSRTYRVDLTGVAKNRAVNLSFDLL